MGFVQRLAQPVTGTGRNPHLAETCPDEDCPRLPCRTFHAGFRKGYQQGYQAGYASGYSDGFAAGFQAGSEDG